MWFNRLIDIDLGSTGRRVGPWPSLSDSKFLIGPAPRHPNVLFAFGHN